MANDSGIMLRRLEIKYIVDRTARTGLAADLAALMTPDRFSGSDGAYTIRSLYFDTPDYMAYHAKIDGASVRHKLRTRIYTDQPSQVTWVRMEIKSRYLTTVHKVVADVSVEDYGEIVRAIDERVLPSQRIMQSSHGVREFFRLLKQYNMEPKILVQYRRQAWERNDISRVRVNFDDHLVASRHLDLLGEISNPRSLLKYGNSVFEIKVEGVLPYWLHMLINKYRLQNMAISKFCFSIHSEARTSATISRDV